jgi:hypothetical protein
MIANFFTDVLVVFCTLPAELFYSLIIEVTMKSLSRRTNKAHIHHFLLAFAIAMEIVEERIIGRDDCDENEMDFSLIIAQCIINNNIALIQCLRRRRCKQQHCCRQCEALQILLSPDHRHLPGQAKSDFRRGEAFLCIKRDYFGIPGDSLTPIFKDQTFQMMFRVCTSHVQRMLEDKMTTNHPFYVKLVDAAGKRGACLEAKVLLSLKTFAYGVPPHTFTDNFQMSEGLAAKCSDEFAAIMKQLY